MGGVFFRVLGSVGEVGAEPVGRKFKVGVRLSGAIVTTATCGRALPTS